MKGMYRGRRFEKNGEGGVKRNDKSDQSGKNKETSPQKKVNKDEKQD